MKKITQIGLMLCLMAGLPSSLPAAYAAGSDHSGGSEISILASVIAAYGVILVADASGAVVVESVSRVGEGVHVVLKGASQGAQLSLELSGKGAQGLSLAVGASGQLLATSTGHVLLISGKVIAFIPNEIGKSLLHHSFAKTFPRVGP